MKQQREYQSVYATVIGAGDWKEADYHMNDKIVKDNFADRAILKCCDYPFDKYIIFGTKYAIERKRSLIDNTFECGISKIVEIPECRNNHEVQQTVNTFISELSTDNSIENPINLTLGLTHGYRHQPMLLLQVATTLDMIGRVCCQHVYYAMLPYDESSAEVLDLIETVTAQRQASVGNYLRQALVEQSIGDQINSLKLMCADADADERKSISETRKALIALKGLLTALTMNHLPEAENSANCLQSLNFKSMADMFPLLSTVLQSMLPVAENLTSISTRSDGAKMLNLAKLANKTGHTANAAVLTREALITVICEKLDQNSEDHKEREDIWNKISGAAIKGENQVYLSKFPSDFKGIISKLVVVRNNISHAFMNKQQLPIEKAKIHINEILEWIDKNWDRINNKTGT